MPSFRHWCTNASIAAALAWLALALVLVLARSPLPLLLALFLPLLLRLLAAGSAASAAFAARAPAIERSKKSLVFLFSLVFFCSAELNTDFFGADVTTAIFAVLAASAVVSATAVAFTRLSLRKWLSSIGLPSSLLLKPLQLLLRPPGLSTNSIPAPCLTEGAEGLAATRGFCFCFCFCFCRLCFCFCFCFCFCLFCALRQ